MWSYGNYLNINIRNLLKYFTTLSVSFHRNNCGKHIKIYFIFLYVFIRPFIIAFYFSISQVKLFTVFLYLVCYNILFLFLLFFLNTKGSYIYTYRRLRNYFYRSDFYFNIEMFLSDLSFWICSPLSIFYFCFFLIINTAMFIFYRIFYFYFMVLWFYKLYLYKYNKLDELKLDNKIEYETKYVFNYLFYCNVVLKAYYKSFETVYYFLKRRVDSTSIKYSGVILNFLISFLIKFLTGFNRYVIIDSYKWSWRFSRVYDSKNYKRKIVNGIIAVEITPKYSYLIKHRVYKEGSSIWNFNPLNLMSFIDKSMIPFSREVIVCYKNLEHLMEHSTVIGTNGREHVCVGSDGMIHGQFLYITQTSNPYFKYTSTMCNFGYKDRFISNLQKQDLSTVEYKYIVSYKGDAGLWLQEGLGSMDFMMSLVDKNNIHILNNIDQKFAPQFLREMEKLTNLENKYYSQLSGSERLRAHLTLYNTFNPTILPNFLKNFAISKTDKSLKNVYKYANFDE